MRGRPETMAGRWAAKEAVSKVLGLGVRGIGWRDIEIERLPTGQPSVRLHGRAAARAEQLGMERIAISITHESDYAVAIAFGVRMAGGRYVFPPDIEDRLDERERRILARIERLRSRGRGRRRRGARVGCSPADRHGAVRCLSADRSASGGATHPGRAAGPSRRQRLPGRRDAPRRRHRRRPHPGAARPRPQGLVREAARHRRLARLRRARHSWSAARRGGAASAWSPWPSRSRSSRCSRPRSSRRRRWRSPRTTSRRSTRSRPWPASSTTSTTRSSSVRASALALPRPSSSARCCRSRGDRCSPDRARRRGAPLDGHDGRLVDRERRPAVLTPHAGEFARLRAGSGDQAADDGDLEGDDEARLAAAPSMPRDVALGRRAQGRPDDHRRARRQRGDRAVREPGPRHRRDRRRPGRGDRVAAGAGSRTVRGGSPGRLPARDWPATPAASGSATRACSPRTCPTAIALARKRPGRRAERRTASKRLGFAARDTESARVPGVATPGPATFAERARRPA